MTQDAEQLWCKVGSHYWDRPKGRGRKPVSCPDHRSGEPQEMTQNGRQPRSRKPKPGTCQFAIIMADGQAELEDGTTVPLANPEWGEGDQGMAEYLKGVWTFTLFEAAPKPKPKRTRARMKGKGKDRIPVEHGVPRVPSQSLTDPLSAPPEPERQSRIVATVPPEPKPEPEVDEDGDPIISRPSAITLDEIVAQFHPDTETMYKLRYIDEQLASKRSSRDNKHLRETQDLILARLRARNRHA